MESGQPTSRVECDPGQTLTVYIYVSIRAQVSGMTVPGDYVFQVNVTSPGHPDLTTQVICTVNPSSSGPVISSRDSLLLHP